MTTEERTERTRHEALLEQLEREVRVIAAGEAANAQRITDTRVELEQQIKQKLDGLSAEHTQHKALLEDLQRQVRVIAEAHDANAQSIEDTRVALDQQIKLVDHRVMVLDVKIHERSEAQEARFDSKLEGLESRIDSKLEGLGKDLSRIVAHLGLDGAPHPTQRL